MYSCPHCSAAKIPGWRKINATAARPARCPSCGGLSYISGWFHLLVALSVEVLFWGSIIVAIVVRSWYALVVVPIGGVALELLGRRAELRATDAAAVARARIWSFVEIGAIVLVAGGAYLFFGNSS